MLDKLLFLAVFFFSSSVISGETNFPDIDAKDLNKNEFNIPDSLSEGFNVFILSFNRDMQMDADEWFQALVLLRGQASEINIYNMPVIPDPGRFVRGFINRGFKSLYKSKDVRSKIIILYVDQESFFKGLNIDENIRNKPVILLLNKNAKIIYRVDGSYQPDKFNQLISFIKNVNY